MSLRTYLPHLRFIVRAVCNYIGDHEEKIKANIGEEHANKVDAVLLTCSTLVAALDLVIPRGS
jgi:hypothetical protein